MFLNIRRRGIYIPNEAWEWLQSPTKVGITLANNRLMLIAADHFVLDRAMRDSVFVAAPLYIVLPGLPFTVQARKDVAAGVKAIIADDLKFGERARPESLMTIIPTEGAF